MHLAFPVLLFCFGKTIPEQIKSSATFSAGNGCRTFFSAVACNAVIRSVLMCTIEESLVVTSSLDDVPVQLYSLIRWILAGPSENLETDVRATIVDQNAFTLSQNLMFGFKSRRQMHTSQVMRVLGFDMSKQDRTRIQ